MSESTSIPHDPHADRMDRMYRYTRHVYDATRRYYLLGRDRLLRLMQIRDGDRVVEMGCGTARNLIKLKRLHPAARLYGLDASQSMLDTAALALQRHGCADTVLRHCLAEQLDARQTFGLDEPFDVIFFSYSLSMMPTWPAALDAALANLRPSGRIYIVDFWDQAGLPRPFAYVLKRWLALFHVHHRPELLAHLQELERQGRCTLNLQSIGGRYAYLAVLEPVG
jgi:S-adenosylmethionine-diacylgycerolhomoserine-N-methlytransferase